MHRMPKIGRFPCPRSPQEHQTVVPSTRQGSAVRGLGGGVDMGRHVLGLASPEHMGHLGGVDGQGRHGVDDHQGRAGVRVDEVVAVALADGVQRGGLVEVAQARQVLAAVQLGGVRLLDVVLVHRQDLARGFDADLEAAGLVAVFGGLERAHGREAAAVQQP